jgi:hypothetical protein
MKVDEFGRILDETVHFGHGKVDLHTILNVYEGLRLSNGYISRNLHMMQDLFCLPETTLLADVCRVHTYLKLPGRARQHIAPLSGDER